MPEDQGHQPIQPRANDYATPSEFLTLATPEYSALAFYHYEDDTLQMHFLFGEDHINRLFDTLRAVPYEWVEDWSNERVGDTLYAFEIRGQDGWPLSMIWSNGYWINAHGDVFSFDYDFSTIFDSFPFDTSNGFTTSFASVPGIRTIALTEKGWDTRFLQPAGLLNGSNDITMELLEITGPSATVALTNHGTEEWFYGVDYTIQVQIDGIWYEVPPTEQVAFVAIAMLLGPGETNEETLDLSFYRELPTGFYRIVKANLTVEFDVC